MPITERVVREFICDRCGKIITPQQQFLPHTRGGGVGGGLAVTVDITLYVEYSNINAPKPIVCNGCARDILEDEIVRLGTLSIPSESST